MSGARAFGERPARLMSAEEVAHLGETRVKGSMGVADYRIAIAKLVAHVDALELRIAPATATAAPRKLPEPTTPLRVRPELPAPGSKEWAEHARRVQAALAQSSGTPAPSTSSAPPTTAGTGESA